MKKVAFIIVLLSFFTFCNLNSEELTKGIGFTAGQLSGIGFNYRQYFEKNGMQFTLGLISNADNKPTFPARYSRDFLIKNGWKVNGWVSAMFLRTIRNNENSRFYYFVAGSVNIDQTKKYKQYYQAYQPYQPMGSPVKYTDDKNKTYFGPGVGIELKPSKYFSIMLELPVSISNNKKIITYIPQGGFIIKF